MKPTSRRNRAREHRLSPSLNQQLNVYALAATAAGASLFVIPQTLRAEVVFTPAHVTLTNGPLAIDLNHDGIADFTLSNKSIGAGCCQYTRSLTVTGAFVGSSQNSAEGIALDASALGAGAVIGPRDLFLAAPLKMAVAFNDSNSFFHIFGQFANKENRFLGFRFVIHGENHYGWAALSVVKAGFSGSKPVISASLNGYAYETVANRPIVAGVTRNLAASLEDPSGVSSDVPMPQPATLGLLALGAPGLAIWRKQSAAEGS